MQNGEKIIKGLQLLVVGHILLILGSFIGLIVDFASLLEFAGLIVTIVGYFKASNGLKNTIWRYID